MSVQDPQENLEHLRETLEDAPTLGENKKTGQEIKVRRSPWFVRSLILILALLLGAEMYFVGQYRKEAARIVVQNPPALKSFPAPEVSAPLAAPAVEVAKSDLSLAEPTAIPLPPELEGIEYPPPE